MIEGKGFEATLEDVINAICNEDAQTQNAVMNGVINRLKEKKAKEIKDVQDSNYAIIADAKNDLVDIQTAIDSKAGEVNVDFAKQFAELERQRLELLATVNAAISAATEDLRNQQSELQSNIERLIAENEALSIEASNPSLGFPSCTCD